ncbi:MAG: efflux RND transporter periplasmic adaptor subunit, partial [Pseudomonas sp.]|uniref:efflux RND transporter periplasmic adaptor subunit n=1 Tax=Pseudomonas sp. TaxID=306 RepID=UPI003BB648D7
MFFVRHLALVLGILAYGALTPVLQAADARPAPEVLVETASAVALPLVFEYSGRTAGFREVQVRAQVSGILRERTYLEGSRVSKGQVMFRIDSRTYQAALARAKGALAQEQARYRQTERDLKRIRELQKKGFASESELDNAISNFEQSKANIQAAEADVQSRQIDLDYCTVTAPISGMTSKETVSEGSLMVAGDPNASL